MLAGHMCKSICIMPNKMNMYRWLYYVLNTEYIYAEYNAENDATVKYSGNYLIT